MLYLFAVLSALLISMVLIPILMRVGRRYAIVDVPTGGRKVHSGAIPRVGGVAMAAGALVPVLLWLPLDRELLALIVGAFVIIGFGVWDDRADLDYRVKFLGQSIAVGIVVFFGGVVIEKIPFSGLDTLNPFVAVPLTILALLGITNAVNLSDGLDGLAGGTTLLSFCGIALLAFVADGQDLTLLTLAVMGGLLGFLRYNTWPAQVFMGDAGSQYLGFVLGVLTIILTQDVHGALSPGVALLLLGFPVIDTVVVVMQRIKERRSPFSADRNHMHHKLLDLGFDHYEAVFFIYIAQSALVTAAYLFRYESDSFVVGIYTLFFILTLAFFITAQQTDWSAGSAITFSRRSLLARGVNYLRKTGWIHRATYNAVSVLISLLLIVIALNAENVPRDFGVMAGILLIALIWTTVLKTNYLLVKTLIAYGASLFAVYLLMNHPSSFLAENQRVLDLCFVMLTLILVVGIRFSWDRSFRVTPLDFIVIFLALVMPNLPSTHFEQLGMSVAKVIVLFYGVEYVLRIAKNNRNTLQFATLGALALIALKGIS